METEFKQKNLPQHNPTFMRLMVDNLRQQRKEHPVADMVAGNLPIVGGIQAGMDMTDESLPTSERALGATSIIPGGKLLRAIVGKLRKAPDEPFEAEEIFQKPDLVMTPEQREAARKKMNEEYAKQLLREEGLLNE